MSKIASLFKTPASQSHGDIAKARKTAEAVSTMLEPLSQTERDAVLAQLIEMLRPIPAPRAGDVLRAIVHLLPNRKDWSVNEIKNGVSATGVGATPKEVYNAIGYLTRKGHVKRIGYGRYMVDGAVLVASDDFGGPNAPHEDSYRTDDTK